MKNSRLLFLSSTLLIGVTACTKTRDYERLVKENVLERALIDTDSEYLYVASIQNLSRSSTEQPFAYGDTKRVKLRWTEEALEVIQTDRDSRFQTNEANTKPVLTLPVTYLDYECNKDNYGNCGSKETEKTNARWSDKTKFKPDLKKAVSTQLELLPILVESEIAGGAKSCYHEVSTKTLDVKIEADAINLKLQRTFKTDLTCLKRLNEMSDATVVATYQYSMVKAGKVLSPGFQALSYPRKDERTFGFFSTQHQDLGVDYNSTEAGRTAILNHWNPNRTQIDYYLSDEFMKPENKAVYDLTYRTFDLLNYGLAKAGVKFRMKLHDGDHRDPGDVRNSMIILEEDPVASGLLGYGPQTEDPLTGEIISARVVMFLGTAKTYLKSLYEDLRQVKRQTRQQQVLAMTRTSSRPHSELRALLDPKLTLHSAADSNRSARLAEALTKMGPTSPAANRTNRKADVAVTHQQPLRNDSLISDAQLMERAHAELKNYSLHNNDEFSKGDLKSQFKYLNEAKNCSLTVDDVHVSREISDRLLQSIPEDAKPWNELSEAEQKQMMDLILPETWVPTLIHELGHNLGLRHNFEGSEDGNNFYSDAEIAEINAELAGRGIPQVIDRKPRSSSVMDYVEDLRALPVLGKYDIAALRFGYLRQIEDGEGHALKVETTLEKAITSKALKDLKDYGYCTDEGVGVNAGCRRFDLGTNSTEITQNLIEDYKYAYQLRNFRNGRESLSLADDLAYASRIYSIFLDLRTMQEIFERIVHLGVSEKSPRWQTDPGLADIKGAAVLAGQFLMSVLTEPDLTCAVAKADAPRMIIEAIPVSSFDPRAISCFDIELKPQYVMVGQYGKLFNSGKSSKSTNPYADQIDVRGYWLDKLEAARALFRRTLGNSSFDDHLDNFADREDMSEALQTLSEQILLNQVHQPQTLTFRDGGTQQMDGLPIDLYSTHVINKPLYEFAGLPKEAVHFSALLASEIVTNMTQGTDHSIDGRDFADAFRVTRTRAIDATGEFKGKIFGMGQDHLVIVPANTVADEAYDSYTKAKLMGALPPDRLKELVALKAKGEKLPANSPASEAAVFALDLQDLQAQVQGRFPDMQMLANVLNFLPH